jgi:hypothetical protein
MPHKNNAIHQQTWRHKTPENEAKYRLINRNSKRKMDCWKKIKMEFLRILL